MAKVNTILERLLCLAPWPRGRNPRLFFNARPGKGGPRGFIGKLASEFRSRGVLLTYHRLRGSSGALLLSASWGNWFHHLCRHWGVRTVLRVDGFYLPTYFDNRPQPPGYQDRSLTPVGMALNYRLQRDLSLSNFVIYQSNFSKRMADHFLFNRLNNCAIIYNGVDLELFKPALSPGKRRLTLLVAGALRHEYMLGTVLQVFRRLWRQADLELMILGNMDSISKTLLAEFRQADSQASERIKIIGPVLNQEMPRYIQQADILLHPRLGDGCPNVVIEALACGLPVICGSWGGAAELVGDGGLVVPVGPWEYGESFVDSICAATVQVLENLDNYRTAARARALDQFDIRTVADNYLKALLFSQG